MAGTFKNLKRMAARVKGGAEAAVAVPFELKCECGANVAGMRRKSWIESECPECCHSVFVLAANVYPSTKNVPSEVLGGTLGQRLKTIARELFPKKTKKRSGKSADEQNVAEPAVAATAMPAKRTFSLPRIDVVGFLKKTFTPFRLLMIAMTFVVGLTIFWMNHQRSLEAARQTWLKSPELIQQLMDESEMVELEQVLASAVAAADVLQRNDPESRRVRNLLEETHAVNSIAADDLLTGFHDAYQEVDRDDGRKSAIKDDAQQQIEQVCRSGTFVFDSYLQPKPGLSDVYLVEFPATSGLHPVQVVVPLTAVGQVLELTESGRAIFSAQIDRVEAPEPGEPEPWILTVAPSSFVLMTSRQHCDYIGLIAADDPTLESVLQRQLEFVEASADWHLRAATVVAEEIPVEEKLDE